MRAARYDPILERELADWRGVTWAIEQRRKHRVLMLTVGEARQEVFFPWSPSDHRGGKNLVSLVRRYLKSMGAERAPRR